MRVCALLLLAMSFTHAAQVSVDPRTALLETESNDNPMQKVPVVGSQFKVEPVATWIPRMPWEHDAHFYSRARFEIDRFGATPPETREEGMRREAISMVYQNMQVLGCTYAKETEAEVALAAGQKMGNASRNRGTGMAMEGEMRAMEILALVGDAGRPK